MTQRRLDVLRERAWRCYADGRRIATTGRVAPPLALDRADRRAIMTWTRRTAELHHEFRADIEPASASATIVCASVRPWRLGELVAGVARQSEVECEFVLVPNGGAWDLADAEELLAALPNARLLERTPSTLGSALNAAMEVATERFVAKFDDDDHYGPHHVADLLRAHRYAHAAVVGRHTYYADVAGRRVLRFPGHEFAYSSTLAGGTFVIDRDRTRDLRFDDVSIGEDRGFIRACHRRGLSTYAGDRFSFVQHRGDANTWTISDEAFLSSCIDVDDAAPEHEVDR